jgi:hypothetical protein
VIDTLRWRRSETCESCDGCTYVKYSIAKVNAVEAGRRQVTCRSRLKVGCGADFCLVEPDRVMDMGYGIGGYREGCG